MATKGTDGNDTLVGSDKKDDTIYGEGGDDILYGGQSGIETLYGGAGNDTLYGGSMSDTLYGDDGADVLYGGDTKDVLYGGAGNDIIYGGGAGDVIVGGAGDDTLYGEGGGLSGQDTFIFGRGDGNDTIQEFTTSEDLIELRFFGIDSFADLQPLMSASGADTLITFPEGETLRIVNVAPSNLTASNFTFTPDPVCYAPGTLILTTRGEIPVEELAVGDRVITADHGPQKLIWIGETRHKFAPGPHKHKPIEIKAGALGNGLPRRRLIVSPQHRMLVRGPVVTEMFDEGEVLALAKGLVELPDIRAMNGKREVTYYSLLCERHEVIKAEGAWSESFYPGPTALKMIGPRLRRQLEALIPALRTDPQSGYGPRARRVLSRAETEQLVRKLPRPRAQDPEIERWKLDAELETWDDNLEQERESRISRASHLRVVS